MGIFLSPGATPYRLKKKKALGYLVERLLVVDGGKRKKNCEIRQGGEGSKGARRKFAPYWGGKLPP